MAIWMAILLMVQESYSTEKVVYPTIDKVLKKSQVVQVFTVETVFFCRCLKDITLSEPRT